MWVLVCLWVCVHVWACVWMWWVCAGCVIVVEASLASAECHESPHVLEVYPCPSPELTNRVVEP